jgi:archaeal preflagellin peptidase FlaK
VHVVPDELRFGLGLLMLGGASLLDLRSRRVANPYWVPFMAVAALLWLADLQALGWRALALPMALAFAQYALYYGMWWFHFFGGADAKGLIVLAFLVPGRPDLLAGHTVPTLDALINGSLLVLIYPLVFLLWNVSRGHVGGLATILGVRMDRARAEARHVWPLERVLPGGSVGRHYWQRIGAPMDEVYDDLRRAGIDTVWVTPKVPFMVPLALGLAMTAPWGNVALWLAAALA